MYDDLDSPSRSGWSRLPPQVRAALICAVPFVVADFFNYYSAGAALVLALPVLALIYLGCGALAAKFSASRPDVAFVGALAAFLLWGISLLINGLIALVSGAVTFGASLLLGLPYICICGPVQLIGGGVMGALGAWLYRRFARPGTDDLWS